MDNGRKKIKRTLAIAGVVLLVLLYLLSLIFAIMDFVGWQRWFFASMGATIILPAFIWINLFLYDRMIDRRKENEQQDGEDNT